MADQTTQAIDPTDIDPTTIQPPAQTPNTGGAAPTQAASQDDIDPASIQPPAEASPGVASVSPDDIDPSSIQMPDASEAMGSPSDDSDVTKPLDTSHGSHILTGEEVRRIADKFGVAPEFLEKAAGVYGATVMGEGDQPEKVLENAPREAMWDIADRFSGGLSTTAYDKFEGDDPKKRAALDALHELVNNKRGLAERAVTGAGHLAAQSLFAGAAADAVAPVLSAALPEAETAAGAASQAKWVGRAAHVAGEAGIFGGQAVAEAKPGEELHDFLWNVGIIGAFHGAGAAIGAARTAAAAKAAKALVESPEMAGAAEEAGRRMAANADTESALAKAVTSGAGSADELAQHMSPEEIQKIADLSGNGGVGAASEAAPEAEQAAADAPSVQDAEAVADDEKPDVAAEPEVYPGSPADQMAAAELELPQPGTPGDAAARAWGVIEETRRRLAERVGGAVEDAVADPTRGPEMVARRLASIRKSDYMLAAIRDAGLSMSSAAGRKLGNIGFIRRAGMFFSDARHVYDAIDNRYGTELTPILDRIAKGYNAYTLLMDQAVKNRDSVVQATKKLLDTTTASGTAFRDAISTALDSGHFSPDEFSPEQIDVLKGWKQHFDWLADKTERVHTEFPELGLTPTNVMRLANGPESSYLPHYVKGGAEFVEAMRQQMASTGLNTGEKIVRGVVSGDTRATDILRGLELWHGGDITDAQTAEKAMTSMYALARTGEALNTRAKSLLARTGAIPDFLREKDVLRLSNSWAQGTFRHLMLRDPLSDLLTQASSISSVSPTLGKYIESHVQDIAGVRRGTLATVMSDAKHRWAARCLEAANTTGNPLARAWYRILSHTDDIGSAMMSNTYSAILGLRPDAAVRYATQPVFFATPQLSALHPADAAMRISKAYVKAMAELATAPRETTQELMRLGHLPSEMAFEAEKHLSAGLAEAGIGRVISQIQGGAEVVNHYAMAMIRASDVIGRTVVKHMAHDIIDDAAAYRAALTAGVGDAAAETTARGQAAAVAIQNLSPGYRAAVQRALREGDVEGAKGLMQSFMTSHTQFDYNRVAMSEFGRWAGGIFSMFSKWPTSILGENLGMLDAAMIGKPLPGSGGRFLTKYLLPLMPAMWLQKHIWGPFQEEQSGASNLARVTVGKNLQQYTPGDSLLDLMHAKLLHPPPGADVLGELGNVAQGDPSRFLAAAADTAVNGIPFGGVTKRLLLDYGHSVVGEGAPINLRREIENDTRDYVVNPVYWALGFDGVSAQPQK